MLLCVVHCILCVYYTGIFNFAKCKATTARILVMEALFILCDIVLERQIDVEVCASEKG